MSDFFQFGERYFDLVADNGDTLVLKGNREGEYGARFTWNQVPEMVEGAIEYKGRFFVQGERHPVMVWLDWEENGYHDSYFYQVHWDVKLHEAYKIETGSTAYAGGIGRVQSEAWTPDELERARLWLKERIFPKLRAAEDRDVLEPNKVAKGDRVRLLLKHRNQTVNEIIEKCDACGGKGNWVNPRNKSDVRECFGCKGAGEKVTKREKVKVNGKQQWTEFLPGVAGEVVWVGTFRTMYSRGYNQPNRATLSCIVKLDDGRRMTVPLNKLRLDKEPMTDTVLMGRANYLSYEMNPKQLFTNHGGWLSANYASSAMKTLRGEIEPERAGILVIVTDEGVNLADI